MISSGCAGADGLMSGVSACRCVRTWDTEGVLWSWSNAETKDEGGMEESAR